MLENPIYTAAKLTTGSTGTTAEYCRSPTEKAIIVGLYRYIICRYLVRRVFVCFAKIFCETLLLIFSFESSFALQRIHFSSWFFLPRPSLSSLFWSCFINFSDVSRTFSSLSSFFSNFCQVKKLSYCRPITFLRLFIPSFFLRSSPFLSFFSKIIKST